MIKVTKTLTGNEPLTIDEVREWLRNEGSDVDDDLISSLITQARSLVEQSLNISIPEQVITLTSSERLKVYLPFGPINEVTAVTDMDAVELSYDFDGFVVTLNTISGSIVEYSAGYAVVPDGLLVGLKELIAFLYENRGDAQKDINLVIRQNGHLSAYEDVSWV